jgi:hypothetical protein
MSPDPAALLNATISHLEHLRSLLCGDSTGEEPPAYTEREAIRRKEASLTIGVLLPKLREVRDLRALYAQAPQSRCPTCED